MAYAAAVDDQLAAPAGFPPWRSVDAALYDATSKLLNDDWLAFLVYTAAGRLYLDGSIAALQEGAKLLADFAATHPTVRRYLIKRAVMLADLQRTLGDPGAALMGLDTLGQRLGPVPTNPSSEVAAGWSSVLGARAEVLRETGRLDEAARHIRQAVQLAFASRDQFAIDRALWRDQTVALATGRVQQSLAAIDEQLAAPDVDAVQRATLMVCRGYAQAGLAGNDEAALQRALATLDEARALAEGHPGGHLRIRTDLKRFDLALRAHDLDAAARIEADCAASLGPAWMSPVPSRDACEFIGYRTRRLLAEGDPDALRAGCERMAAAQLALARSWREQPPQRGGIGFLQQVSRREQVGTAIDLELALAASAGSSDGPARALQILLDLQSCTSLAQARGAPPCTVAELQGHLRATGGVALVLLPTRQGVYTFLVAGDRVRCELATDSPDSEAERLELAAVLGRPAAATGPARQATNESLERLCARVRAHLLPESYVATLLASTGATVVGTDLLFGLPLETLALTDGRLLGEALPIDNIGSLPLAVALAKSATPVPRRVAKLLVIGCTAPAVEAPETATLAPFALPADAKPPSGTYEHIETRLATAADRASLGVAVLGRHDVTHLIVHQVQKADGTGEGGLVMHDGIVWRSDLQNVRAKGLFVVSACGAGLGPNRAGEGEGFSSFVGAFLWNGAQAVITSRRELLALDHLRTMTRLHAQLVTGSSPAAAMQQTRREMANGADLVTRVQRAMVQVHGAGHVPIVAR